MITNINERIDAFSRLGDSMRMVSAALNNEGEQTFKLHAESLLYDACLTTAKANPWFTLNDIALALYSLSVMIGRNALQDWVNQYPKLLQKPETVKNIAVIMAGNIPLVGFHDFLCVLLSGNHFTGKLSSQDAFLPGAIANVLTTHLPAFKNQMSFSTKTPLQADAFIATGSDNTARYFSHYFADKPHIIRKNRSSIAVLSGQETTTELKRLGEDVFTYFGLGCRSVSHLLLPSGFDFSLLSDNWQAHQHLLHHKKYHNNLKHAKALFILEETPFRDMGSILLQESPDITPSVSVLNYSYYEDQKEILQFIAQRQQTLQCVVSAVKMNLQNTSLVAPGQSQHPVLSDYPDGIDTMVFLLDV